MCTPGLDASRRGTAGSPALEPGWPSAASTPSSVSRHDGTITLHGTPAYAGSAADEATRRAVWAEHTVAQTRLEMIRAERNAARRSALDEALAPLLELACPLRTSAERDALAAYVIRKLHNAWNPK